MPITTDPKKRRMVNDSNVFTDANAARATAPSGLSPSAATPGRQAPAVDTSPASAAVKLGRNIGSVAGAVGGYYGGVKDAAASGYKALERPATRGLIAINQFVRDAGQAAYGTATGNPVAVPPTVAAGQQQQAGPPELIGPPSNLAGAPQVTGSVTAGQVGPPASLAGVQSTRENPAPNTFVGSDGRVRTIDKDTGAVQQTLTGNGSLQIASGAPAIAPGGRGVAFSPPATGAGATAAPPGAPASFQRTLPAAPQAQNNLTPALSRNLATSARANRVTAGDFGAPDLGELQRRFKNALGGRLTPSERRGLIDANNAAIGAITGSKQIDQQGDIAATNGVILENTRGANALAVGQQSGQNALAREGAAGQNALAIGQQQAGLNPAREVDAQGNVFVRSGPTLTPVTGADGKQLQQGLPPQPGQITPEIAFKAQQEELASLNDPLSGGLTPEQRAARVADIEARYGPYINGGQAPQQGQGSPPASLQDFIAKAKAANPNASDEELTAYYQQNYGN